jgi:hypothetical protein
VSDFLTRLAERAMGVAPAVQPKLPRRFAPLPAAVDTDLRWWQEAVRLRAGAEPAAVDPGDGDGDAPPRPEPAGEGR